jgi:hypothetical protein
MCATPAADVIVCPGGPLRSSQLPLAVVFATLHARQQHPDSALPTLLPRFGAPAAVWHVVLLGLPAVQLIAMSPRQPAACEQSQVADAG